MSKRILLISPNQHRSLPTQIALLRSGLMVEMTDKLRRALAIVRNRPPSAIVIDGYASGPDGDRVADMLKESPETAQLPIIVLSPSAPQLMQTPATGSLRGVIPPTQRLLEALLAVGVL